jgi:membrane protein YfhO
VTNDQDVPASGYEPKRPTLVATGFFALWVVILSLPMLAGKWLASPYSDMYATGYAFRAWGTEWWKRFGHVPLWEPELFGGMPFVGASHGDIFYPTSFLRLILPVTTVVDLNFVVHFILAGLFTYLLLRKFKVSWAGAVAGGLAYELTGLLASYPSPGHDGQLFAAAALPLALLALVLAIRECKWEGYGLLAIAVALALLGHFQMAYYVLIAAGLFALYLAFDPETPGEMRARVGRLGLALGAVLLGYGLAMIQVLPFIQYIPFSPRAQGFHGFEGSTSFAVPWAHVPGFFLRDYVGARETYWGPNPIKFHSEYLGLPVAALAVLGAASRGRRRLVLWLGGIGLLFLLISMGSATPFYRVWWAVMPLVKKTRAPGMAFFVPAFVTACFAAFGVERLERREGARHLMPWLVGAAVVILLAVTGTFGTLAANVAAAEGLGRVDQARSDAGAILFGALTSGVALLLVAVIARQVLRRPQAGPALLVALLLVLSGDLWLGARPFWVYSPLPRQSIFRSDGIVDRLRQTPAPYRALDLFGVYPGHGVTLMAFDVPQLFGAGSFNEIRYFDELWDADNGFDNAIHYPWSWDLYAVRYVVTPSGSAQVDSFLVSGGRYRRVLSAVTTSDGVRADLYERTDPAPWARVVPGALKVDSTRLLATLFNPRMDYGRLVLFTPDAPVTPARISALPAPSPSKATVTAWEPGRMSIALDPAPDSGSYLVVAENWYPDWRATVDGKAATTLRGDWALLTVPIPAGARNVQLTFSSPGYALGRGVSLASVGLTLALVLIPAVLRRRKRG